MKNWKGIGTWDTSVVFDTVPWRSGLFSSITSTEEHEGVRHEEPRDKHACRGYEIDKDEYYEGTGGYFETYETWQNVRRGNWLERLLTKKDKGNQPRGEDRSFIVELGDLEGGLQSVVKEGGRQPVVDD
jgi:hypothetical protein